jgi:lysosomal acid lipase/cholesteryl ester hydrolase
LQHGIFDSAMTWVLNGKESLGFKLVDLGFDVWLNNSRGNRYSRDHQFLDILSKDTSLPEIRSQHRRFWDFSFHELGVYDQPALMKFVIRETGVSKVSVICHSQGFT